MTKHMLEEMTFVEFREAAQFDPVILIPLGSQEIQGPMAPMGDFMITREIASRVAEASGSIAAPTLPFGYAEYFRSVPGGIALSAEAFRLTLTDILENFLAHGFRRIVLLNGHSGNFPLIDQVIRDVRARHGLFVPCINLWRSFPPAVWSEIHGEFGAKAFGHGSDPMTSVYLHLFPDLVRMDLIAIDAEYGRMLDLPTAGLGAVKFQGVEIGMPVNVDDHCTNGIAGGDPRLSSADKGEKFTAHLVKFCSDFVEHFRSVDPAAQTQPTHGDIK